MTVVVGVLGATTFMISVVLPDAWFRAAMLGGAAVALAAFAAIAAALTVHP